MLKAILAAFIIAYIFAWIVIVIVTYTDYLYEPTKQKGSDLLFVTFLGPLIFVVELPQFFKTILWILYQKFHNLTLGSSFNRRRKD